ncbi:MAG TPA: helix-turn-helix transcriptional regulator [Stellaceae bacterium]|nr:helix-turn-helix transcriptional regulator [Stellaceae bacterium]
MADQVRTRIALQIKALRDQIDRRWSQTELGRRAGKPQNVISRIENPDYGQLTLQTLFDMAAAFDLPLYIDFLEWGDWLKNMRDLDARVLCRRSFDLDYLAVLAKQDSAHPSAAAAAAAAQEASLQPNTEHAAQIYQLRNRLDYDNPGNSAFNSLPAPVDSLPAPVDAASKAA